MLLLSRISVEFVTWLQENVSANRFIAAKREEISVLRNHKTCGKLIKSMYLFFRSFLHYMYMSVFLKEKKKERDNVL